MEGYTRKTYVKLVGFNYVALLVHVCKKMAKMRERFYLTVIEKALGWDGCKAI